MRTIFHVDMNSFFASCEISKSNGKYRYTDPIIVTGDPESRHGIVLAATPCVKKLGLHAGMPLVQARELCPDGIYLRAHMGDYVEYSRRFMKTLQYYSPVVESGGLDEAYVDYSGCERLFGSPAHVAHEIRQRIYDELGLTVSIGVSHNKLLAKQGSDFRKPDAVTFITKENFRSLLWPLAVSDLMYVGPSTTRRLGMLNIHSIGELATASKELLKHHFGATAGTALWEHANGIDETAVLPSPPPLRSISNSGTLPRDLFALWQISAALHIHVEKTAFRLRQLGCNASLLRITLRDRELEYYAAQTPVSPPTNVTDELFDVAYALLKRTWDGRAVRQVGVSLSRLVPSDCEQISFFESDAHLKKRKLDRCADEIRMRHGYSSLLRADCIGSCAANQISSEDKFVFATNAHKLL